MKNILKVLLALTLLSAVACGGDDAGTPDAGADAAPAIDADLGLPYPPAPWGTAEGELLQPHTWLTFIDGDDGGDDPFDESPRMWSMREYYAENDPGAKLILVNAAAGWCGPCRQEVATFNGLYADFYDRGFRLAHVLFEDNDGNPANREFVQQWGDSFNLKVPAMIDSTFELDAYFDEAATPMNMLVDATTMAILEIDVGFSEAAMRSDISRYLAE